jgi:hypothetical protein
MQQERFEVAVAGYPTSSIPQNMMLEPCAETAIENPLAVEILVGENCCPTNIR